MANKLKAWLRTAAFLVAIPLIGTLVESRMAHPTDTHPTLAERIAGLGMQDNTVTRELLAPVGTPLADYLTDVAAVAREVSMAEHQFMADIGAVNVPRQTE